MVTGGAEVATTVGIRYRHDDARGNPALCAQEIDDPPDVMEMGLAVEQVDDGVSVPVPTRPLRWLVDKILTALFEDIGK